MFNKKQHLENRLLDELVEDRFTDRMVDVLPEGQQGVAEVTHFTMSPANVLESMEQQGEEYVPLGSYARLRVNGQLMMTDSPMEKRTNLEIIDKAQGRVLIAGLGLGMILRVILKKPEVTHVTVLEKYQDVADLVAPSLASGNGHTVSGVREDGYNHICVAGTKLEIIIADVLEWKPGANLPHPKNGLPKFHVIYFDIWPRSNADDLPQMQFLHKRYRPLLAKGGWMSSWTYDKLLAKKRDDERFLRVGLPKKLYRTLQTGGGERLADAAVKMLLAPEHKIDAETKRAIVRWLKEHSIRLQAKAPEGLTAEQEQEVRTYLAGYGVEVIHE